MTSMVVHWGVSMSFGWFHGRSRLIRCSLVLWCMVDDVVNRSTVLLVERITIHDDEQRVLYCTPHVDNNEIVV